MSTDLASATSKPLDDRAIAEAWSTVLPRERSRRPGFTAGRIERLLQIALALCGTVMGAQAVVMVVASDLNPPIRYVVTTIMLASLAAMIVCTLIGWGVRVACAAHAIVFPVGMLVLWTLPAPGWTPPGGPWLYLLLSIVVAAAVPVFPIPYQVLWVFLVPGMYVAGEVSRADTDVISVAKLGYNGSFVVVLGLIIVAIVWSLRTLAAGVDEAREAAIAESTRAEAIAAAEAERLDVAALMHDSVMAALIAAGRADSDRQRQLAVAMARDALTRLADAEQSTWQGGDDPVTMAALRGAIEERAAELGVDVTVEQSGPQAPEIPGRVARAFTLASIQAISNAVEHAAGAGLRVQVVTSAQSVELIVSDTGPGADLRQVPADRLGIRASIFARVAAVGATARVDSSEAGTTVTMRWPQ